MLSGDYYFNDELKYEEKDWKYCIGNDRRFYDEQLNGIQPAGAMKIVKETIPEGTYGMRANSFFSLN